MSYKILIITLYYDRPVLLRMAIDSVLKANEYYTNWHIAFHDDASVTPGEPILRDVIPAELHNKVTFYRTNATPQAKKASGGLIGLAMNQMIKNSDADLAIILCDDDALHHKYLVNLDKWFAEHPIEQACYSHVIVYNPEKESYIEAANVNHGLNHFVNPLNPCGRLDASQVAWRTKVNKRLDLWFPYPCQKNHDSYFYQKLYDKTGPVLYSGFYSQYKAIHPTQLAQEGQSDHFQQVIDEAMTTANSHFVAGRFDDAERFYEQILRADPNNQTAREMFLECRRAIQSQLD